MKKILLFAPHGAWTVHHQLDAVVGAALRLRGCDVRVVCCDGIFEQCQIAGNPFDATNCANCARSGVHLFSQFQLPIIQLRSLLSQADLQEARAWADSIEPQDFPSAMYGESPLGQWTAHAMHGYFKTSRLDFARVDMAQMSRNLLYNGVLIERAYARLRQDFQPDHVICYSGAHAYYRVFFELCRRDGIDVLAHERGLTDDSFMLLSNRSIYSMNSLQFEEWNRWRSMPLSRPQFERVQTLVRDREQGRNTNFLHFHDFESDEKQIRQRLRLPENAPLVALFCSGDWEFGFFKSFGLGVTFPSQEELMRRTADLCAEAGFHLVIRHHPLGAGTATYPRASEFLQELLAFNRTLGDHVRVIMPGEKISSYALVWNCDAAVTAFSTIGAEALVRGVRTLCTSESLFRPMGMDWVKDPANYSPMLSEAVRGTAEFGVEKLRRAYRYAHFLYFVGLSDRFKSFGIKKTYEPDIRIRNLQELGEGIDPTLDRVCNHVLQGSPLYALPEGSVDDSDETSLLTRELDSIRARRQSVKLHAISQGTREEPLVDVYRLRQNGSLVAQDAVFYKSLRRSRYKRWTMRQVPVLLLEGPDSFIKALVDAAERAKGDFVYLCTDDTHLDESALSSAVDALSDPMGTQFEGILLGVYGCDKQGRLTGELFTELREASNLANAIQAIPALQNPGQLLALVVWRTASLRSFVRRCSESRFTSHDEFAAALFDVLVSDSAKFHKLKVPAITVYDRPSPDEVAVQGIDAIRAGKAAEGLARLDEAKVAGATIAGVDYARAVAQVNLGRVQEARLSAEEEIFRDPNHSDAWNLLRMLLPVMLQSKPAYAEVARAVESVEGCLGPGQEQYLFEKVCALNHDAVILEIGGYYGRSSVAIAFACAGTQRRLFTIDTFHGNDGAMGRTESFLDVWSANLDRHGLRRYVTPLTGLSHEVLTRWNRKALIDFVFFGASHEYHEVLRDFRLVYPLVKDGGWIAFHDVEPGWPGSWRVWRQIGRELLTSHECCGSLVCGQKAQERSFPFVADIRYSYAADWANYIDENLSHAHNLAEAMLLTISKFSESACEGDADLKSVHQAEATIAHMPQLFRETLRSMLLKDAREDDVLRYWNALTLLGEGRSPEAQTELRQLRSVSSGHLRQRLERIIASSN